jgi:hypothetical protein
LLISQEKWHYVLAENANKIPAEQWLEVRKNEGAEQFYWELVGRGLLSEDIVYWVETQMMAEE